MTWRSAAWLVPILQALLVGGTGSLQPIWLTAIQPFTGADWDAGISMRIGAEILLEEINAHPDLLPGYELKVVWQDGLCSKGVGKKLFLENLFDKKYTVFAHGKSLAELDRDGDGTVTTADVEPFQQVWTSADVSPDPIGLLGSGCAGTAVDIAEIAYRGRWPMVSNSATRPALSDRSTYPNFFRTILPDTFFNDAWIASAKMLGQTSVGAVIGETQNWGSMGTKLAQSAADQGVQMVGYDLTQEIPGFHGMQISIDSQLVASTIGGDLVRLKPRVVIMLIFATRARLVMCEGYKKGFQNAIFMAFGWLAFGWWRVPSTDCTVDEMAHLAHGMVTANMNFWRPDSDVKLACSSNMTAADFTQEWFARQGKAVWDLTFTQEGYAPAQEAVSTADAVCMYAQMLQEVLFNRNISLSELTGHTAAGYDAVFDVLSNTDFEGVQGRVRFEPGQADPKGAIIVQQIQRTSADTEVLLDVAAYRHPDMYLLGRGDLKFHFPGEEFFAGPMGSPTVSGSVNIFSVCSLGEVLNFATNLCEACPPNKEFVQSAGTCLCVAGYVADSLGGCVKCRGGTYAASVGSIQCADCDIGKYSDEGATSCTFCPVGRYSGAPGASLCQGCPGLAAGLQTTEAIASTTVDACVCALGAYEDANQCRKCPDRSTTTGIMSKNVSQCKCEVNLYLASDGSECTQCPSGSSTLLDGKTDAASCLCERGDYMPVPATGCRACPEGMACPKGSNEANFKYAGLAQLGPEQRFLELLPKYWSSPANPMKVYLCAGQGMCPGGKPGSCSANRDAAIVGCAGCLPDHYEGSDGSCHKCQGGEGAILITVTVVCSLVFVTILVWVVNRNLLLQQNATTTCVIVLGLTLAGIQTMGIFSNLTVRWVEPLKSIFEALAVITLDLKVLKVGCIVGSDATQTFLLRQLIPPVGASLILLICAIKKFRDRALQFRVESLNTIGTIYQILFVSVVTSAVQPWICYPHPDDNGFSMVASPGVLCFEDPEHDSLVVIGVLALIFVVLPFLSVVTWATVRYRYCVKLGGSDVHLRAFRFLFFRYHPQYYYFGIVTLMRGLVLCFVPVVARESPAVQIVAMAAVLICFLLAQFYTQPWRSNVANVADGVLVGLMLMMLICAAMSTSFENADDVVGVLGAVVFVQFFVLVLAILAKTVHRRFVPRPYFSRFICHHKADAAAQARLLQMMLIERTNSSIFLDSDNLKNLDDLFDIVRCRVGRLVVFLTRDTLRRPWCAGEISVTYSTHRRITMVKTSSFVVPQPADVAESQIPFFLADGPNLAEYGIVDGVISQALLWAVSSEVPSIQVGSDDVGRQKLRNVAMALTATSANHKSSDKTVKGAVLKKGMVVISSRGDNDEATAAVGILMAKISGDINELSAKGIVAMVDQEVPLQGEALRSVIVESFAVIVVLSAGSMENQDQLDVICWAMGGGGLPVVPVAMPCFRFPAPEFYTTELARRYPLQKSLELAGCLQALFKRIAVSFSTYLSMQIISMQAADVVGRIKRECVAKGGSLSKPTSSIEVAAAKEDDYASI